MRRLALSVGLVATGHKHCDRVPGQVVLVDLSDPEVKIAEYIAAPQQEPREKEKGGQILSTIPPLSGVSLFDCLDNATPLIIVLQKLRVHLGPDVFLYGVDLKASVSALGLVNGQDFGYLVDLGDFFALREPLFNSRSYFTLRHVATCAGVPIPIPANWNLGQPAGEYTPGRGGAAPTEGPELDIEIILGLEKKFPGLAEGVEVRSLRERCANTTPDASKIEHLEYCYEGVCLSPIHTRCICSPSTPLGAKKEHARAKLPEAVVPTAFSAALNPSLALPFGFPKSAQPKSAQHQAAGHFVDPSYSPSSATHSAGAGAFNPHHHHTQSGGVQSFTPAPRSRGGHQHHHHSQSHHQHQQQQQQQQQYPHRHGGGMMHHTVVAGAEPQGQHHQQQGPHHYHQPTQQHASLPQTPPQQPYQPQPQYPPAPHSQQRAWGQGQQNHHQVAAAGGRGGGRGGGRDDQQLNSMLDGIIGPDDAGPNAFQHQQQQAPPAGQHHQRPPPW